MGHHGRDISAYETANRLVKYVFRHPVQSCRRCVCRKSLPHKALLMSIHTCGPLELVCTDHLRVEPSSGYKHILIIMDHFTKQAVVPLRNQTHLTSPNLIAHHHTLYSSHLSDIVPNDADTDKFTKRINHTKIQPTSEKSTKTTPRMPSVKKPIALLHAITTSIYFKISWFGPSPDHIYYHMIKHLSENAYTSLLNIYMRISRVLASSHHGNE